MIARCTSTTTKELGKKIYSAQVLRDAQRARGRVDGALPLLGYMDGMPRAFKIHSSLVNLKLKSWDWDMGRDKQDGGHSRGQFARLPRAF